MAWNWPRGCQDTHLLTDVCISVTLYVVRTTIYLSDALAAQLNDLKDRINMSAVCQAALEREIVMITMANDADAVQYTDEDGVTHEFYGTKIAWEEDNHGAVDVYITKRERIAVVADGETLSVFDTFEEFAEAVSGRPFVVSSVADHLKVAWVDVLDI